MKMESAANALAQYFKNLSDFRLVPPEVPYNHMEATITDAMLQPGLNYETVVSARYHV